MKTKLVSAVAALSIAITSFAALTVTADANSYASYKKVTSTEDITNGEYLIVSETNSVAFDGSLETLDAAGNTVDVIIDGSTIVSSENVDAAAFTIDTEAGTLRNASGSYIGVSSNSNGLRTSSDAAAYKNEFSIDDSGNAVIKADFSGSTMSLRYNAANNQNCFRYYKNSGQNAIALYKKITANAASAAYIQVGDDFTSETAADNIASLWSITITPGDSAITSIGVKAEDTAGELHGTDEEYKTPAITGGSIVVGLVVNHAGADVKGITAVINGDDVKAAADSRSLGLTSVNNARELGGYVGADGKKVKMGAFLRTAALGNASEADIAKLRDDYKLGTVIDLRMDREIESNPDPVIDGVRNVNLKIMDEKAMAAKMAALTPEDLEGIDLTDPVGRLMLAIKAGIVGDQMYVDFLSGEQGQKGYAAMFDELLALPEGRSFLFHCTQGKDRTGCAAMLILTALGVDEDTIIKDFMLTNTYNAKIIAGQRQELIDAGYSGEELETIMSAKDQVNQKYMENAFEWMKENYGSAMGYIKTVLGVTDDEINTLRARFLV